MPRLRKWKSYEIDWSTDGSECDSEDADTEVSAGRNEVVESTATSVSSWWSNEAIISTLPDAKLRSSVEYHRTMVRLLELEMRRRALAPASQRRRTPDIDSGGHHFVAVDSRDEMPRHRTAPAKQRRATPKGLKLSPEQMLKALEILCHTKIQHAKSVTESEK